MKTKANRPVLESSIANRRQFLAMTAAGAIIPAAASFWPTSAKAASPAQGGQLRLAVTGGATSNTLDPATSTDLFEFLSNWSLRNSLVEVDADGNAQPELAESWELSPDGLTWAFKLRKGVEFHGGKSMTSEDVIWSVNHHRGEASTSAIKDVLAQVTEIKADGPGVVLITLKSINVDFPYILSDPHLTIGPSGTQRPDWDKGVGTGGYILEQWDPGVRCVAKRNPNYWKADRAHFDSIELINILDVAARTNALLSGDVDACVSPDNKILERLKALGKFQISELPSNGFVTMPMLTNTLPFQDVNVRLALKYALDREKLIETIFLGHATIGNDSPINGTYRYFASDLPQRHYDPDKAKFHLGKAGLSTLKVDLSAANTAFDGAIDAAVLFAEQAAKAGIEINPVREPDDGYWANVWMKKPFCISSWSGRSTVDWILSIAYAKDAAWNETLWANDRFNTLLLGARAERDEKTRADMYHEMQLLIVNEGGSIVPAFTNHIIAASSKLQHAKVASNWNLDGCRLTERWWFQA